MFSEPKPHGLKHHGIFFDLPILNWFKGRCPKRLRRGMLRLIQLVLRAREDSLIHCGPPCSSWVWVNRGTSQRSAGCPEGDTNVRSVADSNVILGELYSLCETSYSEFKNRTLPVWVQNLIKTRSIISLKETFTTIVTRAKSRNIAFQNRVSLLEMGTWKTKDHCSPGTGVDSCHCSMLPHLSGATTVKFDAVFRAICDDI